MGGAQLRPEDYDPRLNAFVLSLARRGVPRVCFVGTASGDSPEYVANFYRVFSADHDCSLADLGLFNRTVADLRSFVLAQDVVWVGGGNTASLLAVWRTHGLDVVLREAWETGVVLCGSSAGMNCWFEASTTDSFDVSQVAPLKDGLGFLPGTARPTTTGRSSEAAAEQRARGPRRVPGRATPPTTRRRWCSRGRRWRRWSRWPRARLRIASPPTARSRCRRGCCDEIPQSDDIFSSRTSVRNMCPGVWVIISSGRGDRDRLRRHPARPEHRHLAARISTASP